MDMQLINNAKALQAELRGYRRFLHEHAEVGFNLSKTKAFVKERLAEAGYTPKDCGKAGVMATVGGESREYEEHLKSERRAKGVKSTESILLRADMDAFPIEEKTGLAFACKSGNMHACGHDLHTAILLGTAKLLKARETQLPCKVVFLFQPAEEILEGAQDCLRTGILEEHNVKAALTLHVLTDKALPVGTMIIPAQGVGAPAADYFEIAIRGKACHGSTPQNGVDALTVAAHALIALQELAAREISVASPAVLTVGKLIGGSAGNAIADFARLQGTLRAFDEGVREQVKIRLKEIAQGIAKTFRASARTTFSGGCPTLINDGEICRKLQKSIEQVFNEGKILLGEELGSDVKTRSGGSEDFAYITQKVPSAMLALAAGKGKKTGKGQVYPLHHPKVDFDEDVLWIGAAALAAFACYAEKEP